MRIPEYFASLDRRDASIGPNPDGSETVDVKNPVTQDGVDEHFQIRIDPTPEETVAKTPDEAAAIAAAIQDLSRNGGHGFLGFRIEYLA